MHRPSLDPKGKSRTRTSRLQVTCAGSSLCNPLGPRRQPISWAWFIWAGSCVPGDHRCLARAAASSWVRLCLHSLLWSPTEAPIRCGSAADTQAGGSGTSVLSVWRASWSVADRRAAAVAPQRTEGCGSVHLNVLQESKSAALGLRRV
jgi:hypothetical protein